MFRKIAVAAASIAAVAAVAAGPAAASSGIQLHAATDWSKDAAAVKAGTYGSSSIEFNLDGTGWSASTHNYKVPAGAYTYVVIVGTTTVKVCSFALKAQGVGQCANGAVKLPAGAGPSVMKLGIMSGGTLVASAKL